MDERIAVASQDIGGVLVGMDIKKIGVVLFRHDLPHL